ncbi:unnamed protein product [Alopecurus aequalis]
MPATAAARPSGPVLSIHNYRSASPARVKLAPASAARSLGKSVSISSPSADAKIRRSCICSPTNHQGSFRCALHKGHSNPASPASPSSHSPVSSGASLSSKRMGSALVRLVGTESGTWARRALAPSQHRRHAAGGFRPRPSRLSAVSFAGDRAADNQ